MKERATTIREQPSVEKALVQATGLVKVYEDADSVPVRALDGVDFTLDRGEFTAIAGPSGSGKTTLLNLIGGIDRPTAGSVTVAGQSLDGLSRSQLADFRLRHIGFVFQAYNLIPVLSALENAEFILLMQGVEKADRHRRVRAMLADLGIGPSEMDRRPRELSGGQQQRVAVARALVAEPALILADEPTANLDSITGGRLLDKMKEMNQRTGVSFVFSTHDPLVIERARRLVQLRDGRIESDETR